MGFSIGGLLSGAAGAAGSLLSGSGPVGQILGGALTGAFAPKVRPAGLIAGPTISGSVSPTVQQARVPIRFPGGIGFGVGVTVAELLRQSRETTGRPVSSRIIRESVRVCGIETTASAFGLSETDICRIAVSTGRRRARGISASDLRRTRSTIRKVAGIRKQLTALGAGRKVC